MANLSPAEGDLGAEPDGSIIEMEALAFIPGSDPVGKHKQMVL